MKIRPRHILYLAAVVNLFAAILWTFDNRWVSAMSHIALILVIIYIDRAVIKDGQK